MIRPTAMLLPLAATLLVACGTDRPEERLESAADNLAATTLDIDGVNAEIERIEGSLESLQKERKRLRAEQRTLEQRVEARATDVAIFRFVQRELLELDPLRNTAIAVTVEDQRVTLWGTVERADQVDSAVAAAKRAPGVAAVTSHLLIDDEGPAPTADSLAN
ncbi:MAG: BON domain-containing protein [Gammaproteobacteria bacterium]|nr:BON domain-containing protein [Gammaproteobacteria bacterium]